MTKPKENSSLRGSVYFIGNLSHFSTTTLKTLLEQHVNVTQIFSSGFPPALNSTDNLPVSNITPNATSSDNTLETIAKYHSIPIRYIKNQQDISSLQIKHYKTPDFILMACFPYTLPESIIHWPQFACLNIHPSLLPKYRGPDPLFWQLYHGEAQTGVSLHLVTQTIDSGPVIYQKDLPIKNGASLVEIESEHAKTGAKLFTKLLSKNRPIDKLFRNQDEQQASYYPYPTEGDYKFSNTWSAQKAYNFINGTCSPIGYYTIQSKNETIKVVSALGFTRDNFISKIKNDFPDELLIQFSPGILRAKIY